MILLSDTLWNVTGGDFSLVSAEQYDTIYHFVSIVKVAHTTNEIHWIKVWLGWSYWRHTTEAIDWGMGKRHETY